jgi:hypothetical protein
VIRVGGTNESDGVIQSMIDSICEY